MDNALVTFLRTFHEISAGDADLIADATEARSFAEGDYLARPGQVNRELFFICKGVLRIVVPHEKGHVVTHYFLKENQLCTILHSFNNQVPAEEGIQAACVAEVLVLSRQRRDLLYGQIAYLKGLIDQITQQQLLDKVRTRNAYLGLDSTTRYKQFVQLQPDVAMRVSQNDIASYLGITPQSLSRIRRKG